MPNACSRQLMQLIFHQRRCLTLRGERAFSHGTAESLPQIGSWLNSFTGGKVHLHINEKVATVTLDHPEKRNALTGSMMVQLEEKVKQVEGLVPMRNMNAVEENEATGAQQDADISVMVLTGANGVFCSGGDLSFMSRISNSQDGYRMSRFMQDVTLRLARLPLITVAEIPGHALGGGAELTMACDYRLIKPTGKIGFLQQSLGILTGWGGSTLMSHRLPYAHALRILSTGRVYGAADAVRLGLCDAVIDDDLVNPPYPGGRTTTTLLQFLEPFTAAQTQSLRSFKAVLAHNTFGGSGEGRQQVERELEVERDRFAQVWGSKKHLELLEAATASMKR